MPVLCDGVLKWAQVRFLVSQCYFLLIYVTLLCLACGADTDGDDG